MAKGYYQSLYDDLFKGNNKVSTSVDENSNTSKKKLKELHSTDTLPKFHIEC